MKTEKDYNLTKNKLSFAVITKKDIAMQAGFRNKQDAEDFKDNAYCGYYSDCKVELIRTS